MSAVPAGAAGFGALAGAAWAFRLDRGPVHIRGTPGEPAAWPVPRRPWASCTASASSFPVLLFCFHCTARLEPASWHLSGIFLATFWHDGRPNLNIAVDFYDALGHNIELKEDDLVNEIVNYFSGHAIQGPESLSDNVKKTVNAWFEKWSSSNTMEQAMQLLLWIYDHEDFDFYSAEHFSEWKPILSKQFDIPENSILDCLIEGRKMIWG